MSNWRNLFKPWIVERGQAYFECGHVVELEEEGFLVRAKVWGSREYQVEIRSDSEGVAQMVCDCPYAERGENCKHMAAVLFALEDGTEIDRNDWQVALEKLSEEKLRDLLRSLAVGDGALQSRIVRMVAGPGNEPEQWQEDLEQIMLIHTDYCGRIVYGQEYDCLVELAEYLEESVPCLLIDGRILDAAKLVMIVYDTAFGEELSDDDAGDHSIVSDACRKALEQVLKLSDAQEEHQIFELLHGYVEENNWDYGGDDLEKLIFSLDWSAELQEKNLQWLDEHLDEWHLSRRAALMERMGASSSEILAWWWQHRQYGSAYEPLLRLYEETDPDKAIELVREKRKKSGDGWRQVDCTKTLLRLLERAGDQAEYEKELRHLVVKLECHEIEYLTRLNQITAPDRWAGTFEKLLKKASDPSGRMRLYHFEGMYTELFTELCQHPSFMDFLSYEAELRAWNPGRTLTYYTEILKREMDKAAQRKDYRHIIRHLEKMKAYPGGESAAQELAAYWYTYHKNRPAMKDELHRAGYPQK